MKGICEMYLNNTKRFFDGIKDLDYLEGDEYKKKASWARTHIGLTFFMAKIEKDKEFNEKLLELFGEWLSEKLEDEKIDSKDERA